MPTYDYKCECGHIEEQFHAMSAEPVYTCPKCGKTLVKQIGAGCRVNFKGTGFYANDYKKEPISKNDIGE